MQYLRARYYNTNAGQFISKDKYKGDFTQPGTLNRYAYCEGNPVSRIDPSGNIFGIAIGSLIGIKENDESKVVGAIVGGAVAIGIAALAVVAAPVVVTALGATAASAAGAAIAIGVSTIGTGIAFAAGEATSQGVQKAYKGDDYEMDWGNVGLATLYGMGAGFLMGGLSVLGPIAVSGSIIQEALLVTYVSEMTVGFIGTTAFTAHSLIRENKEKSNSTETPHGLTFDRSICRPTRIESLDGSIIRF